MENNDKVIANALEVAQSQVMNRLDLNHKISLFDKIEVRLRYNRNKRSAQAFATGHSSTIVSSDELRVGE